MDLHWIAQKQSYMDQHLFYCLTKHFKRLRYLPKSILQKMLKMIKIPILIQCHPQTAKHFTSLQNPLTDLGYQIKNYCESIHTFSLALTISSLSKLFTLKEIKKIYLDRKVKAHLDISTPTTRANQIWSFGNQGEGVTIAIIDTGIAPHPDLGSRIIAFHDVINKKAQPYDDNGHGTHCAGCAAGNGSKSNGKYKGSAPKASLVGVKVLNQFGEGRISDLIAGVDWCIQQHEKYNIRILSLSLGSETNSSSLDDPLCQIVEQAWNKGLVVVAAAGNNGPKEQSITTPGISPQIITVGATNTKRTAQREDDQIATFSSRGPTPDGWIKPDIVAPGHEIISLRSKGSFLDLLMFYNRVGSHYFSLSGTSMATPIVAGIVALLLEKKPELTPDEVKDILLNHTYPLDEPEHAAGKGLVDAITAYQSLP
jgi:serine protease AprX